MCDTPFVPVARVVRVHGTRGELSVAPLGKWPVESLLGTEVWFVPPASGPRYGAIEAIRPGPKGPLVKVSGISDRSTAEALRGRTLVARPEQLPAGFSEPPLDLVGFSVFDEKRGLLGVVTGIIHTGANDVWVVAGERYGEVLLPVITDVVLEVRPDLRSARVRLLEGLIDEG
ncbi:MAG: 16S rRNA processing protein RimM [Clostridiales bacterium]|nr:16S rRNA processing protein RimM [Clostridiales bacterium]